MTASVSCQTTIYGAFLAVAFSLDPEVRAAAALSALAGLALATLSRRVSLSVIVAPSVGQRILTMGIVLALVACSMGADFLALETGIAVCLCILSASASFFAVTSLSLFIIEARELGYSFTTHIAIARIPAWLGVLVGFVVVGGLITAGVVPSNFFAIVSDVFIVLVTLSTVLHRTSDPDIVKSKDRSQAVEEGAPSAAEPAAKPFRLFAERIAEESGLTPREKDVFFLLIKGRSTRAIQEALYISISTAKTHTASIYRKTGVSSKQELISVIERGANMIERDADAHPAFAPAGERLSRSPSSRIRKDV